MLICTYEHGGLEWSYSVAVEKAVSVDCFIRIYYTILYKNKYLINGYVLRALQEQLSTHKKQKQRNGYQMDQLTFRDAHLDITLQ